MNPLVLLFFIHTTLATALVGGIFLRRKQAVARYFGAGLLLQTVGFASWTMALLVPEHLSNLVTIGAVLTLISFVLFLRAASEDVPTVLRMSMVVLGGIFVFATFYVGRYVFPTPKFISEEGFLIFNLAPFVQLLYITALVLVAVPLIEKLAALFRPRYALFIRYALGLQVVGAIVLITSVDILSLLVAGWAIGVSYFVLWFTLLFRKEVWN